MKIKRIKIKNFRSIGEEGINFEPKDRLNIIVGENNVGKSNILKALKLLVDTLEGKHKELDEIEWYNGITEREIEISVEVTLTEEEIDEGIQNLVGTTPIDNKTKIKRIKKDFGDKVEITMCHKKRDKLWNSILFKWGILYFDMSKKGFLNPEAKNWSSYHKVEWAGMLSEYISESNEKSINNIIEEKLQEIDNPLVEFDQTHSIYLTFTTMFKENFKVFEDIRQKPEGEGGDALESFNGRLIADVLYNLSTGYAPEKKIYKSFQEKFVALFPNLVLEAVKDKISKKPDIHVIKKTTNYEVPLNSMGTGIIEIVIFLTNIIASKNKVFGIEDPELHLHPHAQRLLFGILQEFMGNNQLFIITHSPLFVDVKRIESLILIREENGGTTAKLLPEDYFTDEEQAKLEKNLDAESKEIFFSRGILLVEGETEKGALPIFAKSLNSDFDKNGFSVVWVGGKDNLEIFMKLLEGFKIPYMVTCDKDAIMEISKGKMDGIKTSSLFRQLHNLKILTNEEVEKIKQFASQIGNKKSYKENLFEELKEIALKHNCFVLSGTFEDVLKKSGYDNLMKEAEDIVGGSKARKGRYVAEKIVEQGGEIPKEFEEIISKVNQITEVG